jgi:two-component system, NarL family, response regulator LiaR
MRRTVLLYGLVGGAFIALLRAVEYRFLVIDHSLEIYGGLVALLFSALGIWLGVRLTRGRRGAADDRAAPALQPVGAAGAFTPDDARRRALGITPRELEILEAIAAGLSTREIAGRLFVSENTVKTHAARLFAKLSARRRTEAVRRAREVGLIP